MTDSSDTPDSAEKPAEADRIAKVMARAGIASRREAERMIVEGRVTVNGTRIDSPALDVLPTDRIVVDGKKLDEKQDTRLWLYYKPIGLVTSEADEKGRQTVFDALPRDLPRVMTVGRLDLNSEGLLLLTNDGELKRRLELPATGWLRRYRVRVNGTPSDLTFAPLRRGATIDGEEFAPMEIKLDSQQGANAWLTVGIREGRNREIRRAMAHVGLQVNRLIRIGYGPFKLTGLEKNEVAEVKRRVLRDQLGGLLTGEAGEKERELRPRGAEGPRRRDDDRGEGRRPFRKAGEGEERPSRRDGPAREPRAGAGSGGFRSGPKATGGQARAGKPWSEGDRPRGPRPEGAEQGDRPRRSFGAGRGKPGDGKAGKPWSEGDRPRGPRPERAEQGERPRRSFGTGRGKPGEGRAGKPWSEGDRPRGPRPERAEQGDRPRRSFAAKREEGQEARAGRPAGKPGGGKSFGKPGARSGGGKPGFKGADSRGQGARRDDSGGFAGKRREGGKPFGKPAGRPGGRPQGKPGGRPSGTPRGPQK
ncbi:pseudouridine synthase [Paracoccus marinaquae]|uniref:Pseudouridine synthase n=1 Tax=Paracoccus marinaquae TaxID=2841926 RepID=A0ABS6AJ00_9RHOB|nr:pseudouridine synthase [Paracoccus marinaquae]MBU3030191.1 pseudouridine synthase [Paracoccus marinaquae]